MAMTLDNLEKRREIYQKSQKLPKEELIIADVYYRNAQNAAKKAESEFWASRMILENLVGAEVFHLPLDDGVLRPGKVSDEHAAPCRFRGSLNRAFRLGRGLALQGRGGAFWDLFLCRAEGGGDFTDAGISSGAAAGQGKNQQQGQEPTEPLFHGGLLLSR